MTAAAASVGGAGVRPCDRVRRRCQNGSVLGRLALVVAIIGAACGGDDDPAVTSTEGTAAPVEGCADVVEVVVRGASPSFTFDTTVRSADKGWDKYADAWEVRGPDGTVLGVRELLHPHESEQPFTRSLTGVDVPDGITHVMVAARDSVHGFCGTTVTVALPGRA